MATHLLAFRPTGIHACAIPSQPKPDLNRRKNSSSTSSGGNWWAPLFGLSSEPDYIDSDNNKTEVKVKGEAESEEQRKTDRPKLSRGRLTEEKARQLRMMTTSSASFHDVMYHSAIASRLASDFKDRSDLYVSARYG